MGIDFSDRIELLRMTVMRRATDLASDGDRRRFAENMAFVYRMDETSVLAVLEDLLGVAYGSASEAAVEYGREARPLVASDRRITQRELAAVDD